MFCNGVKEFLSHKGIDFIERDVAQDEEAMRELEALGVLATPVTLINGEVVVGFDEPKLEQLLGLSDNSKRGG
jgi:glutaredoxin